MNKPNVFLGTVTIASIFFLLSQANGAEVVTYHAAENTYKTLGTIGYDSVPSGSAVDDVSFHGNIVPPHVWLGEIGGTNLDSNGSVFLTAGQQAFTDFDDPLPISVPVSVRESGSV